MNAQDKGECPHLAVKRAYKAAWSALEDAIDDALDDLESGKHFDAEERLRSARDRVRSSLEHNQSFGADAS